MILTRNKNGSKTGKNPKAEEVPDQINNSVNWGDLCAVCGKYVPEGRDICPNCEKMSKGAQKNGSNNAAGY